MFTQPDHSQFSRRISRRETILFLSPLSLSLPLSPSWPLAYCLFTGQHRPPLIKPRDGWAVKLYKLLISRETYTSRRDVARNRRKVILLSSFLSSFLPLLFLLSIHRATDQPTRHQSNTDPIQPSPVQVVTGVFNKVNFKTPARTEINFNAGYRLSPARSGFLPALAT